MGYIMAQANIDINVNEILGITGGTGNIKQEILVIDRYLNIEEKIKDKDEYLKTKKRILDYIESRKKSKIIRKKEHQELIERS